MIRACGILIVACSAACAFQQPKEASADPGREADVYAIYSLLLTNPPTSHGPDDNEIYLIAGTTVPGTPAEPCVSLPPAVSSERVQRMAEVLADYRARKDQPATLKPIFKIRKPYQLLSPGGDEFEAIKSHSTQNVIDLFRLSDVYFDHDRKVALTALSTVCGGLCGLFRWRVFEKTADGQWQERSWVTCVTMAQRRGSAAADIPR
jgi:hypothetical protein